MQDLYHQPYYLILSPSLSRVELSRVMLRVYIRGCFEGRDNAIEFLRTLDGAGAKPVTSIPCRPHASYVPTLNPKP